MLLTEFILWPNEHLNRLPQMSDPMSGADQDYREANGLIFLTDMNHSVNNEMAFAQTQKSMYKDLVSISSCSPALQYLALLSPE